MSPHITWIPESIRRRYREQPPIDSGETDEERARAALHPKGNVTLREELRGVLREPGSDA